MTHIDRCIARVRLFAKKQKWTRNRYAKEAGLRDTVLRSFDDPNWNPTVKTIRRLEAVIPEDFDFLPKGEGSEVR